MLNAISGLAVSHLRLLATYCKQADLEDTRNWDNAVYVSVHAEPA